MNTRIVSDSACNLYEYPGVDFVSVPMKVNAGDKVYIDDSRLDVLNMMTELSSFKGKSNTGHPSIREWIKSFGDADNVFGVTVTSKLSGSYNSAVFAAEEYMEENPGRQAFILDSLSTGPEMELIIEKYNEMIQAGLSFAQICSGIQQYLKTTHIWWSLTSLKNFVANGRINPAVAGVIKLLGICIVGTTNVGELQPVHRCNGSSKAMKQILNSMLDDGFRGGKVRIRHSFNPEAAEELASLIRATYPNCDIKIGLNTGLCGYYVEKGGVVAAFEGSES